MIHKVVFLQRMVTPKFTTSPDPLRISISKSRSRMLCWPWSHAVSKTFYSDGVRSGYTPWSESGCFSGYTSFSVPFPVRVDYESMSESKSGSQNVSWSNNKGS